MKRFIYVLLAFVLGMLAFTACKNGEDEEEPAPPQVTEKYLALEHTDIALYVGDSFALKANLKNLEGTVTWSSDNETVATVENGTVEALSEGNAVITAALDEYFAVCTVRVYKVEELSFPFPERKLQVGRTMQILPQYLFKGQEVSDKEFNWSSSDVNVAVVDEEGYITAKKAGKTVITAESGSLSASFELNVVNNIALTINTRQLVLNPNDMGKRSAELEISVKKNGVTVRSPAINWRSLDEAIVRLTPNAGKTTVTAFGTGNTAVVGEYEGEIITCIVTSYKVLRKPEDFELMRNDLNGWFKLMNNVDFTGYMWSSITPWQGDTAPDSVYFGGIFDGQGYTISNITFYSGWHQGLFGQINKNAVVKNVSLVNAVNQKTSNMTGSIVALNYGLIENVYVETTVQADSDSIYNATGGLVGLNARTGIIRNCIAVVTAKNVYKNVGALVGYNWATIYNCYAVCTDAQLPAIHTQTPEIGYSNNCYVFSDETELYDPSYFRDFDKSVWAITGFDLPALKYFPQVSFKSESIYLTIGKTYHLSPSSVKGMEIDWKFDSGYEEYFRVEFQEDGSVYVTPLRVGETGVRVSLANGSSAAAKLIAKRVTLLPEKDFVFLDYNNPGLADSYQVVMFSEDGLAIPVEEMAFVSSDANVAQVSEDGRIKATGGGSTFISVIFDGDTYVNLIEVKVRPWVQVSTPEDLENMRNDFSANYCLVNDIDYGGKTFPTIAPWDGFDSIQYHFGGIFDGNGYTISNLRITGGRDTSGIWGQTAETSVIRNTNFVNIFGPEQTTTSFGIVGFNEGIVENCYVEITVTYGGPLDYKGGGGIVGTNEFRGTVRNCITVVNVQSMNEGNYFGSLVGLNQGLIENCFSVVHGNARNRVDKIAYENGTTLATKQYSGATKAEASAAAINGEAPFGSFDSAVWNKPGNQLPSLKRTG